MLGLLLQCEGALRRGRAALSSRAGDHRGELRAGSSRCLATGLNNLALLLQDTNRRGEAEPLYRRALAIGEASFGPDHPDVANRLNNLANCCAKRTAATRRSRFIAAGLRSTKRATDRITPLLRPTSTISRLALRHEPSRRGGAVVSPRAGDRRRELRTRSPRCCEKPQQSRALAPGYEPPRRGGAVVSPRAGDRRGELSGRITPMLQETSTTSRLCSEPRTVTPRRSRCFVARWRSTRRGTGRITPMLRETSTISRSCSKLRTAAARRSRSIAARWRSTRRATGRITPVLQSALAISRACSKPRTPRRGGAVISPGAGDRRGELRPKSSRSCD